MFESTVWARWPLWTHPQVRTDTRGRWPAWPPTRMDLWCWQAPWTVTPSSSTPPQARWEPERPGNGTGNGKAVQRCPWRLTLAVRRWLDRSPATELKTRRNLTQWNQSDSAIRESFVWPSVYFSYSYQICLDSFLQSPFVLIFNSTLLLIKVFFHSTAINQEFVNYIWGFLFSLLNLSCFISSQAASHRSGLSRRHSGCVRPVNTRVETQLPTWGNRKLKHEACLRCWS